MLRYGCPTHSCAEATMAQNFACQSFFFLLCAFSLLFFHESLVKNTYNGFLSFSGISPSVPLSVIANNVANQIKLH